MTGPEHYREAERLLVHTEQSIVDQFGEGAEAARQQLAMAQAHATLALAAATAFPAVVAYTGDELGHESRGWAQVTT